MSRWDSRTDPASARRDPLTAVEVAVAASCACVVKVLSALVK